jgi:hypothetical protein
MFGCNDTNKKQGQYFVPCLRNIIINTVYQQSERIESIYILRVLIFSKFIEKKEKGATFTVKSGVNAKMDSMESSNNEIRENPNPR